MRLEPGTVAYWADFSPGNNKYIYILGVKDEVVFSFTISSQLKYLKIKDLQTEMIEIPYRNTDFLNCRSFIQCFYDVTRTPVSRFLELGKKGTINWRACLPEYMPRVRQIVANSEVLTGHDMEDLLLVIPENT